jgi:hypothetical protein
MKNLAISCFSTFAIDEARIARKELSHTTLVVVENKLLTAVNPAFFHTPDYIGLALQSAAKDA